MQWYLILGIAGLLFLILIFGIKVFTSRRSNSGSSLLDRAKRRGSSIGSCCMRFLRGGA